MSSCIALAPVAHSAYTQNAFYDFYDKYWRSFKGHVNHELWGKGYVDRLNDHPAPEDTYELEKAFWKSYEPN